tara:strand:- start:22710 stop:23882 length:1173 start_codon:yes stop_codon:yes gene_type:complete
MGGGSTGLFLSIIIAETILSDRDYGLFSIVVTTILVLSAGGVLSLEQVLIRLAIIDEGESGDARRVSIPKWLIPLSLLACLLASSVATYFVSSVFLSKELKVPLFAIFFACALSLLVSAIYRINREFVLSQLVLNLWRIGAGFIFFILFLTERYFFHIDVELYTVVDVLSVWCVVATVPFVFVIFRNDICFGLGKEFFAFFFGFFLSVLVVIFLNNFDKYMAGLSVSVESAGSYFYWFTLLIYPFSMMAAFISMRKLVDYKVKFSFDRFRRQVFQYSLISSFVGALYFSAVLFFSGFFSPPEISWSLILLFYGVCILKIAYSLLSSAFGAVSNSSSIIRSNILFVFMVGVIFFVHGYAKTLEGVAILLFLLLFIRSISFYVELRVQFSRV